MKALEQGKAIIEAEGRLYLLDKANTKQLVSDRVNNSGWLEVLDLLATDKPSPDSGDKGTPVSDSAQELIIYTDGGSRGNPGPSASGYVIMNKNEEVIEEGGEYLGITTNNQAEYQAVKLALEEARKLHAKSVQFYIDSLLVVNQMNGIYKIKNRELWPVYQAIKDLATDFEEVTFSHVRREFNKLADAKVNEILDSRL